MSITAANQQHRDAAPARFTRRLPVMKTAAAALLAVGLVGLSVTPAWAAPPANDNFANATVVTGPFTDTVDTTDATLESGEPSCYPDEQSVWYTYTAPSSGTATIDTDGSDHDTVLTAYTGTTLGSLTQIACNDDDGTSLTSRVTFSVAASTTYYIRASKLSGGSGGSTLVINGDLPAAAPAADLAAAVTDSADPASVGDSYTYTTTVTNNGPAAATNDSTTVTLSGAARTIVSATSSQGSCTISAPTVTCAIGGLANSALATVTVTVEAQATGSITATATTTATETDPTSGDNTDAETTTINNAHGCTITGTAGNDTLTGTSGADVICALGGDDTINGRNGADTIYAGSGNDSSYGEDLLSILDNGADTLYGGPGNDNLDGQNGDDTLIDTSGTDTLSGSNGNDNINTQDGVGGDTANGGLGSDTCTTDPTDSTSSC